MERRRLLTVGDSFTYGEELAFREKDAYPFLLQFDEVVNLGKRGGSSDYVFRTVIETLISDDKGFDLVLVSWPEQSRMEQCNYPFNTPTNHMPRLPNEPHPPEPKWIQEYYKHSYSDRWGFRKQYNQIVALQGFLQAREQKYCMYNVAGLQEHYDQFKEVLFDHYNAIDEQYFIGWPYDGILEWQGDCAKGPDGHPLELGHRRIAKVIDEHIRNIGWFS